MMYSPYDDGTDHMMMGPQGLWGSGENGYFFSGSWGALVITFSGSGEQADNSFCGFREPCQKVKKINFKNLTLKEKPPFCLIF